MLWLMRFSFEYIPNWGIAIIILTVLVKLLSLPLTIKQYKSMAAMKKIQPLMKSLQEKYSDDKVRMQQELMKLYREHQVNPLAGCLPMVMMMPIYFAHGRSNSCGAIPGKLWRLVDRPVAARSILCIPGSLGFVDDHDTAQPICRRPGTD